MKVKLTPTEIKILEFALVDDDRLQTHYSKELFNCHYLPDLIQHLRPKLKKAFNTKGIDILPTEYHVITKIDGKTSRIGIYRIKEIYKEKVKTLLEYVNEKK